jgi:hypothetical protein
MSLLYSSTGFVVWGKLQNCRYFGHIVDFEIFFYRWGQNLKNAQVLYRETPGTMEARGLKERYSSVDFPARYFSEHCGL